MKGILTLVFSLVLFTGVVFGQTQKTFVKSFNMNGNNYVILKLQGAVEVKEWSDSFMRVHTDVTLENASSEALKFFLMQGRYNLKPAVEDGALVITSVERQANVKYRGQDLGEKVSYTVFIPKDVEAEIYDDGTETSVIYKTDTTSN